jgi:hypothetical protein
MRKVRLAVASFLANQAEDARLWFWVRRPEDVEPTRGALGISGALGLERVSFLPLTQVDWRLPAGVAQVLNGGAEIDSPDHLQIGLLTDLTRYMLIYRFGGIWADSDILFLRDLAPLVALDFAYVLGSYNEEDRYINNAVMGASSAGSPFMGKLLLDIASEVLGPQRGLSVRLWQWLRGDLGTVFWWATFPRIVAMANGHLYEAWGTNLLKHAPQDLFHLLPSCYFETNYWNIFKKDSGSPWVVNNLMSANRSFTHHWHGRWDFETQEGSFADQYSRWLRSRGLLRL